MSDQYSLWWFVLLLTIAVGLSYLALMLAQPARRTHMRLINSALILTFGIGFMHFIGMQVFAGPARLDYQLGAASLSMLPSLLAFWITLNLLARHELTWLSLITGGVTLGAGIWSMHYLGMAATEIGPRLSYDPVLFVLSGVFAVVLGTLSLWIGFKPSKQGWLNVTRRRLLAAIIMGLAIACVHWISMAAAQSVGIPTVDFVHGSQPHAILSLAIAAITVGISLLTVSINAFAHYRALFRHSQEVASELKAVIDAAVDGIIKISDKGLVLSFNEAAEKIFGYRAEEVIGKNVSMLMPNPHRDAHDNYIASYLRTGERKIIGLNRQVWALHKNGHEIPVSLAIGESRLNGTSTFVGFVTDISEQRRMETDKEAAEQAPATKSAFLANMSHEIRTPMNAIIGFTDLVLDSPLTEQQARHLGVVKASAHSLLMLLNDILDTAKLEGGHTRLEVRDFSLRTICEQVVASQSLAALRKGLSLNLDYRVADFFKGDPLRVQQIVLNLLSNAVKFTEQGSVKLAVYEADGNVVIRVEDTGIGIPADRVDKIFEPFTQADSSMTRRFGGTGLGTTIARQLTELMGGTISVTSKPGEGTTFQVSLPLRSGNAAEMDSHLPLAPSLPTLPPLTLLVADDVPQNLELLCNLLTQRKHTVVTATNGREALARFAEQEFDLVLMDVQMPEMNGHEATRAIRHLEAEQSRPRTPIIALTASVLEEDRRQADMAGMDGFAAKPIDVLMLEAEIARVMGFAMDDPVAMGWSDSAAVIDRDLVEQLWADAEAHLRAAELLLGSPENHPDELSREINVEFLSSRLHRLRGLAGNLGFTALAQTLGEMDTALRRELPLTDLHWQQLQAQFKAATDWLISEAKSERPGPDSTSSFNAALQLPQLDALITQLQHGEIPEQAFADIKPSLPEDCALAVQDALENFEPDLAARRLAVFRSSLREPS